MSLTLEEIKERLLRLYDPDDLLEALQISAEDCSTGLRIN